MRLLIAGWQGQIASALVRLVPQRKDVTSFAVGRPALDLCELPTLHRAMSDAQPDVIINAAAYTAVDRAESDAEAAFALNRDGARMLAETAASKNIPIVHLSSDYVFDGQLDRPYREDDQPSPQTVYGQSKLEGELAVADANPLHVILRTSWVYSATGRNFVRSIVERASAEAGIDVVSDQTGSPTYAPDLARVVLDVARAVAGKTVSDPVWGVCHAAGSGEASWFDIARHVMTALRELGLAETEIRAISSSEYPTIAPRPVNARLACDRLEARFDLRLPDWRDSVRACVDVIVSEERGQGDFESVT